MALHPKPNQIKHLLLGAGALGFLLRVLLYTTGMDDRGLLVRGHWAAILLWILTAATGIGIFLLCRKRNGPEAYRDAFPPTLFRAAGAIAAAAGFAVSPLPGTPGNPLATAETVLRFAAALSLLVIGICRFRDSRPSFLLHSVVCLYLALRLVCRYRIWSSHPQMLDYCFQLGAYVALMLTAYQLAAFDAGLGNHKKLWAAGLASVYLCTVSVWGEEALLMLCLGFWIFSGLSNLEQKHGRPAFHPDTNINHQEE